MIWKRYAAAVIGLLFSLPYCAQQDTLGLEKSFLLLDEAMSCYESSPGISFCKELLQEAYKSSGKHAYFLEKIHVVSMLLLCYLCT